jgi:hypothetical protein
MGEEPLTIDPNVWLPVAVALIAAVASVVAAVASGRAEPRNARLLNSLNEAIGSMQAETSASATLPGLIAARDDVASRLSRQVTRRWRRTALWTVAVVAVLCAIAAIIFVAATVPPSPAEPTSPPEGLGAWSLVIGGGIGLVVAFLVTLGGYITGGRSLRRASSRR